MDNSVYTKEITEHLKRIIKQDVESGIDRQIGAYLDTALESLKRRNEIYGWNRYKASSVEDRKRVKEIWKEIQPEIINTIEHFRKDFRHKKMTKDIKVTTARAAIKVAMNEAGLKHHFVGQAYRAKVSVLLTENRAITIYILYKKLQETLPQVIESLKLIKKEIDTLGSNLSINRVYHGEVFE